MPDRQSFATRSELAAALAGAIAADLKAGIASRGAASIAVSGGSTPALLFRTLSAVTDIAWDKVVVTLVDERWVDEASDRSNARLVKADLLQGPAAAARFVPLYQGGDQPDSAGIARAIAAQTEVPMPFDVVILGMGGDGHTASFFPGGDRLTEALTTDEVALSMHAVGAGEARVTLSLKRLLATKSLCLHIEGEEKARVLEKALGDGPVEAMPIRAVLRQTMRPVTIYWAP